MGWELTTEEGDAAGHEGNNNHIHRAVKNSHEASIRKVVLDQDCLNHVKDWHSVHLHTTLAI